MAARPGEAQSEWAAKSLPPAPRGDPSRPAPYTRAALAAAVAVGRRVCLVSPGGSLTDSHEDCFAADLAGAVGANVDGGPWRAVVG